MFWFLRTRLWRKEKEEEEEEIYLAQTQQIKCKYKSYTIQLSRVTGKYFQLSQDSLNSTKHKQKSIITIPKCEGKHTNITEKKNTNTIKKTFF